MNVAAIVFLLASTKLFIDGQNLRQKESAFGIGESESEIHGDKIKLSATNYRLNSNNTNTWTQAPTDFRNQNLYDTLLNKLSGQNYSAAFKPKYYFRRSQSNPSCSLLNENKGCLCQKYALPYKNVPIFVDFPSPPQAPDIYAMKLPKSKFKSMEIAPRYTNPPRCQLAKCNFFTVKLTRMSTYTCFTSTTQPTSTVCKTSDTTTTLTTTFFDCDFVPTTPRKRTTAPPTTTTTRDCRTTTTPCVPRTTSTCQTTELDSQTITDNYCGTTQTDPCAKTTTTICLKTGCMVKCRTTTDRCATTSDCAPKTTKCMTTTKQCTTATKSQCQQSTTTSCVTTTTPCATTTSTCQTETTCQMETTCQTETTCTTVPDCEEPTCETASKRECATPNEYLCEAPPACDATIDVCSLMKFLEPRPKPPAPFVIVPTLASTFHPRRAFPPWWRSNVNSPNE